MCGKSRKKYLRHSRPENPSKMPFLFCLYRYATLGGGNATAVATPHPFVDTKCRFHPFSLRTQKRNNVSRRDAMHLFTPWVYLIRFLAKKNEVFRRDGMRGAHCFSFHHSPRGRHCFRCATSRGKRH